MRGGWLQLLAVHLVLIACVWEHSQASVWVSDAAGSDSYRGTIDAPFKTLARALAEPNEVLEILIEEGVYSGVGNNQLLINGSRKVDFLSANLSATAPIIDLSPGMQFASQEANSTLSLSNLVFRNAKPSASEDPSFAGSVVTASDAVLEITAIQVVNSAGPILVLDATSCSILGAVFVGVSGSSLAPLGPEYAGGAVVHASCLGSCAGVHLNIHESRFLNVQVSADDNSTILGGAVMVAGYDAVKLTQVTFANSVIISTSTAYGGAAAVIDASSLVATNCNFTSNSISLTSGALTSFMFASGGALYVRGTPVVQLSASVFAGNLIQSAGNSQQLTGGALSLDNSQAQLQGLQFLDNQLQLFNSQTFSMGTRMAGAAVAQIDGLGGIDISGCSFISNKLRAQADAIAVGITGGVVAQSSGSLTDSSFVENAVHTGGDIVDVNSQYTLVGWVVFSNTSGNFSVADTAFQGNVVMGYQSYAYSAIYLESPSSLRLLRCNFTDTFMSPYITGSGFAPAFGFFLGRYNSLDSFEIIDCIFRNLHFESTGVRNYLYGNLWLLVRGTIFSNITVNSFHVNAGMETFFQCSTHLVIEDSAISGILLNYSLIQNSAATAFISTSAGFIDIRRSQFRDILIVSSSSTGHTGLFTFVPSSVTSNDTLLFIDSILEDLTVVISPILSIKSKPILVKGLIYIGPPTEENLKTITMLQNSTFRRISISGPASLAGGLLCYEGALSTVLILDQVLVTDLSVTLPRENPTPVYVTGGVIYTTGLPTLIVDTVFSNLSISAPSILGAAILIDGATNVSIVRSSFIDINSHGFSCGQDLILNNGGAVFFRIALIITTSAITVRDSIFDANTATCAHGGSLSIGCGHTSTFSASCPTSIVTIEGCSFTRSAAALGGALSIDSSIATVSNCTFADNSALAFLSQGGNGGAIYGNISVIQINSCSFSNNSAILGGAAYFRRNVELVIANSTWDLNAATSLGSALLIESAIQELAAEINASSISSCYFSNHQSMSAVIALNNADKLSPTHLQVVDTKFFNNTGGLAVSGVFGLASNLVALTELNCVAKPEALDITALAGLFSISLVRTPLESNSESPCVPGFELLDLPTGTAIAGNPIVGQFLASPICNSSSASFSDSQIMSTYVWADVFGGQGTSSNFSNVTVIHPSMLEVPIDLVLATEWILLPRDTFNDVFLPPVDVTIEPGCPTVSTFIVDAGSLELVIPCASAVGVVTMRASDGYHNPISEPQASCPIPNVTLVSTGTPVIYGVTAWNSTVEAYITTYDAYDGGLYYMFVTLESQQINKSPFTVEVIKPSTNISTLSCIPVANSSFIENTQVLCTLLYDTPTLPYPYCGSSIHCTTVSFLYEGMPDTNISVTDFTCVSLNALSFTWLLGSPGDYQVLMEIAGVPMLPVSITAFSTGHSSTSWWQKFGWYTLAVGILLILAVVAVIVAYLHYRRKRLDEGRYTIVGAEFADIPESGKFLLSLVALLDDASITKIPWREIILPSASVVDQPPQMDFLGDVPKTPDPGAGRDPSFASSSSSSFSSLPSALPQLLGAGAAGKVWRAKWRELPVAVKRIYVTSSVMDNLDADVADFFVEIKTLSGFDHPNILRFLGVSVISYETSELALVTELMECSLERIIFSKSKYHELTPRNKIQWALDIARGLQYLHLSNPPIIHRDIKPENVLVSSTGVLKLADFGVSTFKPKAAAARNMTIKVGSPNYFAPEVFDSETYTESCDIYSFGVLLVEIFAGHRAYQHSDVEDLGIAKLLYKVVNEGLRPPLPPDLHQIIRNIITESFSPEPLLRPSSSEIVGRISRLLAHMG